MRSRARLRALGTVAVMVAIVCVTTAALAAQSTVSQVANGGTLDLKALALLIVSITGAAIGVPYGRRMWRTEPGTGSRELLTQVRDYLRDNREFMGEVVSQMKTDRALLEERRQNDRREADRVMETLDRIAAHLDQHEANAVKRAERILEEGRR